MLYPRASDKGMATIRPQNLEQTSEVSLRICSGRHMANNALFIDIASLLWGTNISAVKDEAGKPIIPDTLETVNSGLVV